ncbi:PEP-CTERM sorting domain-containing protein [Roseibacillus persicicus]|uniref:PEP-CTERM sorting domain-containing protein n=1 Tax=Roseibacillus persicicus TaxID=454148 RepID=UPI00398A84D2
MKSLLICLLVPGISQAATITTLSSGAVGLIPDGSTTGIQSSLSFTEPLELIQGIEVTLELSAAPGESAYLGDLYFYLTDGTNLVTLMNRAGQDSGLPGGYSDNQSVSITFAATSLIDIHTYREAITGNASTPLSGPLTGIFQADGRLTDPSTVATGDSRDSSLTDYEGITADRTFTLFGADLSTSGSHQIDGWSVTLTTVPEPSASLLSLIAGLTLLARRKRQS